MRAAGMGTAFSAGERRLCGKEDAFGFIGITEWRQYDGSGLDAVGGKY